MTLVFIDQENGCVRICGEKTVQKVPFSQISTLKKILPFSDIVYVSDAQYVDKEFIINTVQELNTYLDPQNEEKPNKEWYLKSNKGVVMIPGTEMSVGSTASSMISLKQLQKKYNIDAWNNDFVQKMRDEGFLEIIDEDERKSFKDKNHKDAGLDSIIVDSVDSALDGDSDDGDDIIQIDLQQKFTSRKVNNEQQMYTNNGEED